MGLLCAFGVAQSFKRDLRGSDEHCGMNHRCECAIGNGMSVARSPATVSQVSTCRAVQAAADRPNGGRDEQESPHGGDIGAVRDRQCGRVLHEECPHRFPTASVTANVSIGPEEVTRPIAWYPMPATQSCSSAT